MYFNVNLCNLLIMITCSYSFLERYLEEHLMESLAMEANYAGCGEKLEHMIQHYIYA
jgi:hypothetical protein